MKQILTKALLAAMVGMGGLSAAPVAAFADGIYFGFDTGPGYRRPPPDRFMGDPDVYDRRRPPPPPPDGGGGAQPPYMSDGCSWPMLPGKRLGGTLL